MQREITRRERVAPARRLSVGEHDDLLRGERGRAREQLGARRRRAQIARAAERLAVRRGIEHRVAAAAVHHAVGGDEPHAVGGRGALQHVARARLQLLQHRTTARDGGGAERVVEHDRERGARVAAPGHADDRMRRRERDEQHRSHAQEHEQQIAQPQVAAVLALRAHEIAHRGKLDARARAAPHQMDEQRHRGGGAREKPERCEKAHYASSSRAILVRRSGVRVDAHPRGRRHGASCRAENARRSGTPNGAVGDHRLVRGAVRGERATPLGHRLAHSRLIRRAHIGDRGRDLDAALRIDEQRLVRLRQIELRGIEHVHHDHLMPRMAQSAHGRDDVFGIHEQIGDEHDHPTPRDEAPRGLERRCRVRRAPRSRLLERRHESNPLPRAHTRRHRRAHDVIEAHETDGVALAQKQERDRRRESIGVRELGEAGRLHRSRPSIGSRPARSSPADSSLPRTASPPSDPHARQASNRRDGAHHPPDTDGVRRTPPKIPSVANDAARKGSHRRSTEQSLRSVRAPRSLRGRADRRASRVPYPLKRAS